MPVYVEGMQEKILAALRDKGPLKTGELSLLVGKKKAKDVLNILNKLAKRNTVVKTKVGSKLLWSITEENESIQIQTNNENNSDLEEEQGNN